MQRKSSGWIRELLQLAVFEQNTGNRNPTAPIFYFGGEGVWVKKAGREPRHRVTLSNRSFVG
jgi:hypothetical protein